MTELGESVDQWAADGAAIIRALLAPEEVRALGAAFEFLRCSGAATTRQVLYTHDEPPDRPPFQTLMEQWLNPHLRSDSGSTGAVLHRVGDVLAARCCDALVPLQDVLLAKHAGHRAFPWHQDEPYWPVDTSGGAIVWCSLDPVSANNGGLELAVGSHLLGLAPAIDLHTGLPQDGSAVTPELPRVSWRCPVLAPGDALVFHPRLWHRSGVNHTPAPRRAWSSSWLPRTARWAPERAPRHPLAARVESGALVTSSPRAKAQP